MNVSFSNLIYQLAEELDIDLQVDVKGGCSLLFQEKIPVQMELSRDETELIILAFACNLPPGKFREKVLFEALKINDRYPRFASLGFFDKTNQLTLYHTAPYEELDGKKLASLLAEIIDLSLLWNKAIESNLASPPELQLKGKTAKSTVFDIKK